MWIPGNDLAKARKLAQRNADRFGFSYVIFKDTDGNLRVEREGDVGAELVLHICIPTMLRTLVCSESVLTPDDRRQIDQELKDSPSLRMRWRVEELQNSCRQARACLLNLMPEERNPLQAQMQKMVGELSAILDY